MPDLLIVYELNPEKVFSFVVTSASPKYEPFKKAHGLLVGVNDDAYPDVVVDVVAEVEGVGDFSPSDTPAHISGEFLVIHCGVAL